MSDTAAILPPTNPFATIDRPTEHVQLLGVCSVNAGSDEPCEAIAIAIDRISVRCAAAAAFAEKVVFSFPEFGLVEGSVTSVYPGGFEACFETSTDSKLALYLACVTDPSPPDQDALPPRIVPVKRIVTLEAAGEPESMARIIDLSRSGVAITTSKELAPDQLATVGSRSGHVVRVFEGGVEVAFDEMIAEHEFDPLIDFNARA